MWLGLWVGVCLWLVTIATYKLLPISTATVFWIVIVGLSFPVIGLALGLAKRFAARDTARWLDQETGLKERLSTAVELTKQRPKGSSGQHWSWDAARPLMKLSQGGCSRFDCLRCATGPCYC